MKLVTKFATAALLAVSVAAPAFAVEPEAQQLAERNAYVYANGPAATSVHAQAITGRGMDSFAQAPGQFRVRDNGIGSQS